MATLELTPNTGPGSFEYVPGETGTIVGINCADAGDRITMTGWKFANFKDGVSDVKPDSKGYLPHFAIKPVYARDAGLGSVPMDTVRKMRGDPTSGNIEAFPFIRVDFGSIWLPYAASVTIQGGDGPGAEFGSLLITLQWDRFAWKRKTPVHEKRDQRNTFTVYKASSTNRIERPTNAIDAFCPDGIDLKLDNGPGTYQVTASMGTRAGGRSAPLGSFGSITPVANADSIIFTVQL